MNLRAPAILRRPTGRASGVGDRAGQQGAVLVLVALAAVALMGAVGLGLDGSRLLEERRAAQAAVDHAATAAAYSSCTGSNLADAIAAGEAAADRNGYDNDGTTNVVTVSATGAHEFRAAITSQVGGTFSRVLGFTVFEVGVEGVAGGANCGLGLGEPGAIYAGGTCSVSGKYAVDVSGSSNRVIGGIHANDDVNVGGSSNHFTDATPPEDPFTHVGSMNPGGGNVYETGYPKLVSAPSPPWPSGWEPGAVTGGSGAPPTTGSLLRAYYDLADANGTSDSNDTLFGGKITSITKDGVYYTTSSDGMDISSMTGSVRNVALIAPNGPIKISLSSATLNAITDAQLDAIATIPTSLNLPRPGILMLSNAPKPTDKKCEEYTIALSGSDVNWNGFLWAPTGQIEMSGSTNVAVNGGLVGWSVKLNGSNLRITYNASLLASDPSVFLVR